MTDDVKLDRRRFLTGTAASLSSVWLPGWARPLTAGAVPAETGTEFSLRIGDTRWQVDGRTGRSLLVNGTLPGPLLRWREGDDVTLRVTNDLDEDTSIHWHGILLPFQMDGVPGVTFPGIKPGTTFTYRFRVAQAGTYWYHSHSGLQEQLGHYGPIIIDPREPDPVACDREYVVVLSDFSFEDPHRIFAKLKKMSDAYNFQQRTLADFFEDVASGGLESTVEERAMWGRMRMNATDIADVTGATYTYLVNGHGPEDNWKAIFRPGERIRLRFINASAMTIFNVRIPGLPLTMVQADGLPVRPVVTDEFQIGVAETFDAIVVPDDYRAFTLFAESNDRSGYARATLTPEPGLTAPVPALRPRPTLTMRDMGMAHHGGGHTHHTDHTDHGGHHDGHATSAPGSPRASAVEGDVSSDPHAAHRAGAAGAEASVRPPADAADPGSAGTPGMEQHAHAAGPRPALRPQDHEHEGGPGVVGRAEIAGPRLAERPLGLGDAPHRVLTYADLVTLEKEPGADSGVFRADRELELHLTGNMERYMWSFDGVKFSEVTGPIVFTEGERVRLTLVNDTMMPHPIHLHGMFFDIDVSGAGQPRETLRKHTVVVKPAERLPIDIHAEALGDWAFHCHLLYHMHAGMMRVVSIRPGRERVA